MIREARAEATKAQSEAIQEKLSKIRPLRVEEVVDAFNIGLDKDSNGAALAVFPGIPPHQYPEFQWAGDLCHLCFPSIFIEALAQNKKGQFCPSFSLNLSFVRCFQLGAWCHFQLLL